MKPEKLQITKAAIMGQQPPWLIVMSSYYMNNWHISVMKSDIQLMAISSLGSKLKAAEIRKLMKINHEWFEKFYEKIKEELNRRVKTLIIKNYSKTKDTKNERRFVKHR